MAAHSVHATRMSTEITRQRKEPLEHASNDQVAFEPLLTPNPKRFVLFPIQYPDIWKMYKKVSF